jgi:hypothetical protein
LRAQGVVDALLEFIKGKREISATKVSTALSLLKKIVPGQTMEDRDTGIGAVIITSISS